MTLTVNCDYCKQPARLTDSAEVYGRSYGLVWLCEPCGAWVGTHKNSPRHVPLGRLANAELREAKKAAHAAFDPLWQTKVRAGMAKGKARNKGYHWLADELGIDRKDCHIGMFDVDQCRRVVDICAKVYA